MRLKWSFSFIVAFLLLLLVMMELHELVHITVGRIICGCWGTRDFNVWSLADHCRENNQGWWMATLAGPLFSFGVMWLGAWLLSSPSLKNRSIGFVFVFANIPFGRITTVMMGGGDEMVVLRHFMDENYTRTQRIIIGSVIVLLAGIPPVIKAWRSLSNQRSWIYIIGFLTLPLVFLLTYLLTALNTLLANGFLSTTAIMGTPILISLHTLLAMLLLWLLRKKLLAFHPL